jgi:hypothetical protein
MIHSRIRIARRVLITAFACCAPFAWQAPASGLEPTVVTIAHGLRHPQDICVRPEGGQPSEVFVADRGARKIIRVIANRPDTVDEVIVDVPVLKTANDQESSGGVQALYFLDHLRLLIAGTEQDDSPFIRLYELQDVASGLQFNDQKQQVSFPEEPGSATHGIREFRHFTRTRVNDRVTDALLLATADENRMGALWKVPLKAGTLGDITPLQSAKGSDTRATIGGIAVGNSGYITVAAEDSENAMLKFVNPIDGSSEFEIETHLSHIVGLCYAPTTGDLFAACSNPKDSKADGVYRLDDVGEKSKPRCRATRIASVAQPTAVACGPDGALYVTALGDATKSEDSGMVLRLTDF